MQTAEGAPSLSRLVRQGGDFDFGRRHLLKQGRRFSSWGPMKIADVPLRLLTPSAVETAASKSSKLIAQGSLLIAHR